VSGTQCETRESTMRNIGHTCFAVHVKDALYASTETRLTASMKPLSQQLFLGTATQSLSTVQVKKTPVCPSVAASATSCASPPASSMAEVMGGVGPGPVALQAKRKLEDAALVATAPRRKERRRMAVFYDLSRGGV
jgi:hypothetical protein